MSQVQSQVRELRFPKPHSVARKKKKYCAISVKKKKQTTAMHFDKYRYIYIYIYIGIYLSIYISIPISTGKEM